MGQPPLLAECDATARGRANRSASRRLAGAFPCHGRTEFSNIEIPRRARNFVTILLAPTRSQRVAVPAALLACLLTLAGPVRGQERTTTRLTLRQALNMA